MKKLKFEELQHKFHDSVKTLKAFHKEEGISYSTYIYWSKKFHDEAVTLSLATIEIHERRESYASESISISEVELPSVTVAFPNGVRVHFGRGREGMIMKY